MEASGQNREERTWIILGLLWTLLMCATLPVAALQYLLWTISTPSEARLELDRMLAGDTSISMTRIVIMVPRAKPIVIEDPEALGYLNREFHASEPMGACGAVYHVQVDLTTGRSVECAIMFPLDLNSLTVSFPTHWDCDVWQNWRKIPLDEPIPPGLLEVCERLGGRPEPDDQ